MSARRAWKKAYRSLQKGAIKARGIAREVGKHIPNMEKEMGIGKKRKGKKGKSMFEVDLDFNL
jgi:hypothetical protein